MKCAAIIGAVLLIAPLGWSADVIIKIGDQANSPIPFQDGDIIHVFDAAEIKRQWAEIDARGDTALWVGHDRTRTPMSDTMLKEFLVLTIDETLAAKVKTLWCDPELTGETITRRRRYKFDWQSRVSKIHHDAILSKEQKLDLRGIVADLPENWVELKP